MILTERQMQHLVNGEWHPFSTFNRQHFKETLQGFLDGTLEVTQPRYAEPLNLDPAAAWDKYKRRFEVIEDSCIEFKMTAATKLNTPICLHLERRRLHPVAFLLWTHGFLSATEAAQWGHRYVSLMGVRIPIMQGRLCDTMGCCNPAHYDGILLPYAYAPVSIRRFQLGNLNFNWEQVMY